MGHRRVIKAGWTWAAARCRGVSHVRSGLRLQDACKCFAPHADGQSLVVIVSDGAGSAPYGGEGASLVCRTIATHCREHFSQTLEPPEATTVTSWLDQTRDLLAAIAHRRASQLRDFAATLIFVASTDAGTVVFHIGDGCAVFRNPDDGSWYAPIWPIHGEYASTTSFVTDDAGPQQQFARIDAEISAMAVFSDGLERLVLDLKTQKPHAPFFDGIITPIQSSLKTGRDAGLSSSLKNYLDRPNINERTDDDKTLVLAVRR